MYCPLKRSRIRTEAYRIQHAKGECIEEDGERESSGMGVDLSLQRMKVSPNFARTVLVSLGCISSRSKNASTSVNVVVVACLGVAAKTSSSLLENPRSKSTDLLLLLTS
jgi:hypothetical protein